MTGRFITFEGGEGAGKSTQIEILASAVRARGIDVRVTREPGGTTGGEAIRELLVHGQVDRWNAISETLLINAARADHVQRIIRPALEAGSWVLCDRYVDSTFVYQGYSKGVSFEKIAELHRLTTDNLWPDMTIILDVTWEVAVERIIERIEIDPTAGLRFEAHADGFHQSVAEGFRVIAEEGGPRCNIVDANGSIEGVAQTVWSIVEPMTRAF